ncbi:unnamed protein product [Paramecium octaurelia]|uniref:Uncharacterized protein n=1 Tax=Paramecium octaurelia TaxID=43137 RepID=A0A8S1Y621_PAROT|nr:unnamed protein product [Paramecium octaurelia]
MYQRIETISTLQTIIKSTKEQIDQFQDEKQQLVKIFNNMSNKSLMTIQILKILHENSNRFRIEIYLIQINDYKIQLK